MPGEPLWSHDVRADAEAPLPMWGFAASPLVIENVVIAFAGADSDHEDQSVLGYDATSATRGKLLWHAGDAHHSYCSPQPARLAGADQVLLTSDIGLTAFDATHGVVLWEGVGL